MTREMTLRKQAAELFDRGYGYKAVAATLEINKETARDWSYTWRALGTEALLEDNKNKYVTYPPETKLAVVKARHEGKGVVEVMAQYQIPNRHRIKEWVRLYDQFGEAAFFHQ